MCPDGEVYHIHCGSDFGQGKKELMMIHDTTFQSCLSICDSMNLIQNRSDVGCTFYDEDSLFERPGTCWCVGNTTKIAHEAGHNVAIPQRRREKISYHKDRTTASSTQLVIIVLSAENYEWVYPVEEWVSDEI